MGACKGAVAGLFMTVDGGFFVAYQIASRGAAHIG